MLLSMRTPNTRNTVAAGASRAALKYIYEIKLHTYYQVIYEVYEPMLQPYVLHLHANVPFQFYQITYRGRTPTHMRALVD